MSGGFAELERVLAGIRAAQDADLTPIKLNCGGRARTQRSHRARPGRAVSRHRHHRALHRVHGRRQPQPLEPRSGRAVARAGGAHRCALAATCGRKRTITVKSPSVTRSTMAQARSASSPRSPIRSAAAARVHACHPKACSTRACSRATGVDLRAPLREGATDEELHDLIANTWLKRGDRYSELRSSLPPREHPLRKIEMYYIGG